jgi:ABC-type Fe3+ transport system substrate-binding protein
MRMLAKARTMAIQRLLTLAILATLIVLSVGSAIVPASAGPDPTSGDWDSIVRAARTEGAVIVSGPRGLDELQTLVTEGFQAAYGIHVDYSRVGPDEIVRSVPQERARGEYRWDVFMGGNDTLMFNMKRLGVLAPIQPALILPEVRDPNNWEGNALPFFDHDGIGLAYGREAGQYFFVNTALVDPNSITTYRDLLDHKWKGQMFLTGDPREGGHARSIFTFFYEHPALGPEFVRQMLTEQDIHISRSDAETDEVLVRGEVMMCMCNRAQGALLAAERLPYQVLDPHRIAEGIDVTSSFANVALVDHPPHPNASVVFLNWLLSRETGTQIQARMGIPSTRADVPKTNVLRGTVPEPGWLVANHEDNLPRAAQMVTFLRTFMED